MKIKKKVRMVNQGGSHYDVLHESFILIDHDLPWPKYIIHQNKGFRHDGACDRGVGIYIIDYGFYSTIEEYLL